jgi:hypothetical protein
MKRREIVIPGEPSCQTRDPEISGEDVARAPGSSVCLSRTSGRDDT